MRRTIILALALFSLVQPLAMAQQAGENINVLPVVPPEDQNGNPIPDWYLKGDGYLQRQVEPTIAASTRNPDHLLAFFVDYRAVDIPNDSGMGEADLVIAAVTFTRTIMMAASGLSFPEIPQIEPPPIAASEAWVGMSRSYDGGLTWSGGLLPGADINGEEEPGTGSSLITPVDGLEAATDPVLAAGPCGRFYLVFMAFTRGGESKLVVARYQDLDLVGGGEHIVYNGMTVLESGNNATHGYFLDKPDIEVDIFREPNTDICADRVYVSYSTFNGLDKDLKFQSKINFAYSTDHGETFTTQKLNPPYKRNQGSALAVDPRGDTPNDPEGGGTVYMVWRHFWDPDAILMTRSTNYGVKWSKPTVVTGDQLPMYPFDQPGISVDTALPDLPAVQLTSPVNQGFPDIAFRSNAFPTAAVTDEGKLFVAWQERVGGNGAPTSGGTPRIVMVRSSDGGDTWTDLSNPGIEGNRWPVDVDERDTGAAPEVGFGTLHQQRLAGPQVQPKLVFSGGQLLLAYYESRGRIANYDDPDGNQFIQPIDVNPPIDGWIGGYDRLMDFRAALLHKSTGDVSTSFQLSRYPIRADASGDEDITDVVPVNWPCYPDSGDAGDPLCVRQVNRVNAPQSAAGTTPFIGDYQDVASVAQFIYDQQTMGWRWATLASDHPSPGFHAIFSDNRHLRPPPSPLEWEGFPVYKPPYSIDCTNAGSRNTDVLTSRINTELVLSAPSTYKSLTSDERGFPFTVQNNTAETRLFQVALINEDPLYPFDDPNVSLNARDFADSEFEPVHSFEAVIFGHSSASFVVFVNHDYADPVRVEVSEQPQPADWNYSPHYISNNSTGTLTFNIDPGYALDPTDTGFDTQYPTMEGDPYFMMFDLSEAGATDNPFVINPFVINQTVDNPFVINPFVINPFVINPFVINPFVINPFVINPFVINPFVINPSLADATEAVIDTTWTITPGISSAASSYLPLVNIDNAENYLANGYSFQLIVHKGSLYGSLNNGDYSCDAVNVQQPQILSNYYQSPGAENPFVINPFVINPFVINPFVINPFVINSAFTMAPTDDPEFPTVSDDGTTKAKPPSDKINITLRAFKPKIVESSVIPSRGVRNDGAVLKETMAGDPPPPIEYAPWEDKPSLVIVPIPCDPDAPVNCNVTTRSPDLVPYLPALDPDPQNAQFIDGYSIEAAAGGDEFLFPEHGWTLTNEPAHLIQEVGDARPENGELRHGFYVCKPEDIDFFNDDLALRDPMPVRNSGCVELAFIGSGFDPIPLNAGLDFSVPSSLTIPSGTLPGPYFLVLHPDDTLEISERNEFNNLVMVPLTVTNPPPVADDLPFTMDEDTVLANGQPYLEGFRGDVFLRATDPNGDPISYEILSVPDPSLTLLSNSTGEFQYVPILDFNGEYSFEYRAYDGPENYSNTATVTITVRAVNDEPIAGEASFVTDEDTPLVASLRPFVDDIDLHDANSQELLTFSALDPANGTVDIDTNTGDFTYTPDAGFDGEDFFTYQVADYDGAIATATVTITVNDTVQPWLFIGFDNPWETNYTMGVGSTIPLKWRYADPATGQTVSSFTDPLPITATHYPRCNIAGEPEGDEGVSIALPGEDAGDSDLRYKNGVWQLNWDTADQGIGCYVLTIYHPTTGQTNTQNADGENLTIVLQ